MINFQRADGWIFLSIAHGQGEEGTNLEDLIGTADAINHAIPTNHEINGAVNRFLQAGLVTENEDIFQLTMSGLTLFHEVRKDTGYLLEQWDLVETLLKVGKFEKIPDEKWGLDTELMNKAYKMYSKKFRKKLKELEKEDKKGK